MAHLEYKSMVIAPTMTSVMHRLLELIRLRAMVESQPLNFDGRDRIAEIEADLVALAEQIDNAARPEA